MRSHCSLSNQAQDNGDTMNFILGLSDKDTSLHFTCAHGRVK